jgi:UDPglucose 6-dehydrogenase
MRVCMIGVGYVGLVTGACFAEIGHEVVCVDTDPDKIRRLADGETPFYEPGLKDMLKANRDAGRISFTTEIADAVEQNCAFYFIAVGTPAHLEDGGADVSHVYRAAEAAAEAIKMRDGGGKSFPVFVVKSTVPVGTSREIGRIVGRHLGEDRFAVASNPEFLRQGCAIADFMAPDRLVAGSRSERARTLLEELYRPLTRQGRRLVLTTTVETAELIKYAANAFLATKITFINELGRLCEKLGADVEELSLGMGLDKRIGDQFLTTGPGYGGSCFPKDTLALIKTANDLHSPVEIVETVVRVNSRHKHFMFNKVRDALGGSVADKKIAVLGLAFKANTDDVRDSPALTIVPVLQREGARVTVYDPIAADNARLVLGCKGIEYASSLKEAIAGSHAVVILTEWEEFRSLDWGALAKAMAKPLVIDLRNLYSLAQAGAMGVEYISLGRNPVGGGDGDDKGAAR